MRSIDHDPRHAHPPETATSKVMQPVSQRRRRDALHRFEALVQLAPDATVVVDRSGHIRLVNRQAEQLFGYPAEEMLGQPVELLIPERLHDLHQQHRAVYAAAPRIRPMGANLPLSGRRRDGSEFPIEASLGPLDQRRESLIIVSIHDLSELQLVHDAHVATQAAYQDLRALQALTDTALSHLSLEDLVPALLERVAEVLNVDSAAALLLDPSGQTLTLQAAYRLDESASTEVHVPAGQDFAGRIAATREPLVVDDIATFPIATPLFRKEFRSVAGVPLLLGDQLLGVVTVATALSRHFTTRDVQMLQQVADRMAIAIDRARLYAQAQVSEHRYRRLVEANIIGVAVTDTERVMEANDAFLRLVGYSQEDVQAGRLCRDSLTTPDTHVLSERTAEEAVETGASMPFERKYVRKDGSQVPVLVGPVLLQRDPLRVVNFVIDLTERKQLEQTLAERVAQLEAIMEAVPDALAVFDTEGHVLLANAAYGTNAARFLKSMSPEETVAERHQQAGKGYDARGMPLTEEEWPQARAVRGEVLAGADAVEISIPSPEGELVSLSITGAPLRDADGRIIGAVTVSRDITERKRLERERAEARAEAEQQAAQLAATFEAMADGVVVYDAKGRVLQENAAQQRLEGTAGAPPHFAQLPLSERMELFNAHDEHGRPLGTDEGPLPRALRGEMMSESETMDLHARTLDGREVVLNVSAAPLRDRDGRLTGAVAVFRDQTEQKRLERERTEQAEQLNRIFEGIADGLVVYNAHGQPVRLNTAARHILGLDVAPATYAQLPATDRAVLYEARDERGHLLAPEDWPLIRVLSGQVREADTREVRLRMLDGHEVEVITSAAPLWDRDGHLLGAVTILHDQTEQRRLAREREEARAHELALENTARHMDEFLATASHDLRTPLTVVKSRMQLALRQFARLQELAALSRSVLPDVEMEAVSVSLLEASHSTDRLTRLVTLLFDVAQARSGVLELKLTPCDLATLVQRSVTSQQVAAAGRRIELEVPGGVVPVEADADRLDQVLSNFLSNALKYSSADQPVTLHLKVVENQAVVSVTDHGPGLPPEEQCRIWEVFHRVPGVEVQSGSGDASGSLGLGLHICKQLVELHPGGRVGVESMVGEGSTFWFQLPLASKPLVLNATRALDSGQTRQPGKR